MDCGCIAYHPDDYTIPELPEHALDNLEVQQNWPVEEDRLYIYEYRRGKLFRKRFAYSSLKQAFRTLTLPSLSGQPPECGPPRRWICTEAVEGSSNVVKHFKPKVGSTSLHVSLGHMANM